jgi:hypothetical protein
MKEGRREERRDGRKRTSVTLRASESDLKPPLLLQPKGGTLQRETRVVAGTGRP